MVIICISFCIIALASMAGMLYICFQFCKRVDSELARFSVLSESCMRYLVSKSAMEKVISDGEAQKISISTKVLSDELNKVMDKKSIIRPTIVHTDDGREIALNSEWELM